MFRSTRLSRGSASDGEEVERPVKVVLCVPHVGGLRAWQCGGRAASSPAEEASKSTVDRLRQQVSDPKPVPAREPPRPCDPRALELLHCLGAADAEELDFRK